MRNGVSPSRVFCPALADLPATLQPQTLYDFLCDKFPHISPATWQMRFEKGDICNTLGEKLGLDAPYIARQTVQYYRELPAEKALPYLETILYADEYIVVADKPHFLPVIPSGQYVQETLLVRLKRKLNLPELSPIHRIDRDTAGVVVFCVQKKYRAAYHALFRLGQVQKIYVAIASTLGEAQKTKLAFSLPFKIENWLEDDESFMQMRVKLDDAGGEVDNDGKSQIAMTHIVDMQPLPEDPSLSRYTLQPKTGKRHQLRVHMMHIGIPILGDQIYPVLRIERDIATGNHAPLQLLAKSIAFTDPITKENRQFDSARSLSIDFSKS